MKKIFLITLIASFVLAACAIGAAKNAEAPAQGYSSGIAPQEPLVAPALPVSPGAPGSPPADGAAKNSAAGGSGDVPATSVDRLVIQNADLSIVVADPKAKMDAVSKMVKEMGGYVVSSNLSQSYTPNGNPVPQASLVIRVPAEKLDETLEKIKKDGRSRP